MKKRTLASSMMTTGRHSKKIEKTSPDEEELKGEVGSPAKIENVTDAILKVSGPLEKKAEPAFQGL